jgi:cytochrome P450
MARSTLLRWLILSMGPGIALRRSAKAGEIAPRIAMDKTLWRDPFPWLDALREQGPLVEGKVMSATASHAVTSEVLRSAHFGVGIDSESLPWIARKVMRLALDDRYPGPAEPPSLLAVDPPQHTRYRRLVSKAFTARAVAALEKRVEEIADELLDAMEAHDEVDLVDAYAAPLPVRIIAEILGVPEHMQQQLLDWGNAAAVTLDPALSYATFKRAADALQQMHLWLGHHLAELRRNPGDDLMSQLATLTDDGDSLTDVELRATALLVTGAGFETTVNLIGNGVMALLTHPDQLAVLRDDSSLWDNATDEVLRWDSPVQNTVRFALQDTEVCGLPVRKGSIINMMVGGANRDPAVFADPHAFDVRRGNARDHLAFSAGVHFCLGASLARLEGSVALRKLFERFPDLSLAGQPQRRPLRVLRGFEHLPVRLNARDRRPAAAIAV